MYYTGHHTDSDQRRTAPTRLSPSICKREATEYYLALQHTGLAAIGNTLGVICIQLASLPNLENLPMNKPQRGCRNTTRAVLNHVSTLAQRLTLELRIEHFESGNKVLCICDFSLH